MERSETKNRKDSTPESTLSRGKFLKMGGVGLAGLTLLGTSGCGGGGGQESGVQEVVFSWGSDDTGTLPKLIEKFNKQNEGKYRVRHRVMSSDTGQYFNQLKTEFQAGYANVDVIGGDVIWPAQFAANGWIVDLSDRFTDTDEFLPGPMQANSYDGKVWGVPWYTDAGLLYFRKDLLEKSGFSDGPRTWDELKEQAKKVQRDSGIESGFVFQGAQYEGGVCDGLEYVWTHGGDVLATGGPNRAVIESPESIAGLATERSMIEDGISPQAVSTFKEDTSHGVFVRGRSVFLRNWPYVYALLGNPKQSKIRPEQVGITPIPVDEGNQSYSTLGGWNFFINAGSEKQDAAWEFVKFMSAPDQQKMNALQGSKLPTRRSLYEDQEILSEVPVARLGKEAIIDNSRPRPVSPYYSDMSLVMAKQFNASLKGNVSPEQAVKTIQERLQNIVEQGT